MSKHKAVLISDIHFNINTLPLASSALKQAVDKANSLKVPLIIAGDMHDSKANLRGECVNAMLEVFKLCDITPYVIIGNHCRLNEKAPAHALNFLSEVAIIVDEPMDMPLTGSHGIPYYHDPEELRAYLKTLPAGSRIIMHQGIEGSHSGDYIQDKSAITHDDVKDFRVISGHYHRRQDIKTGRPRQGAVGLFSYIGNPFTLGFGEAGDPEKGFQVLKEDGALEFIPTNLRKHAIIDITLQLTPTDNFPKLNAEDLVWIKIKGSKEQLLYVNKENTRKEVESKGYVLPLDFRLDLIPTDTVTTAPEAQNLTQGEVLDQLIDSLSNTSDERKSRLKALWKAATCG